MAKQKKPSYKWIYRLIDKITKSDAPNNNEFIFYGHRVVQSSGTVDYTAITLWEDTQYRHELADFSFDYWTKHLHFDSYRDYDIRNIIVAAFIQCYDSVRITDNTIEEVRKENEEYVNNPDVYTEEAVAEAQKELDMLDALPMGWVNNNDIKK